MSSSVQGGYAEVNASVTSQTTIFTQDCISPTTFRWVSLHLLAPVAWGGVTVQFEVSNDNATWNNTGLINANNNGNAVTLSTGGVGIFHGPVTGRYFRARVSAYTSGTVQAIAEFYSEPGALQTMQVNVGTATVNQVPTTSGGLSTFHLVSAATTNATNVKASGGQLYGYQITNTNAAARKLALHNTAGTPTAGASVFASIMVPASGQASDFTDSGIAFGTGIAITTTTLAADSDATAVALNDLIINLFYK